MIKLWLTDFNSSRDKEPIGGVKSNILKFLTHHFDIELTPKNPDYLLYSCFGINFLKYQCPRIFFSEENLYSDPIESDFSFSYNPTTKHNFYFPSYYFLYNEELDALLRARDIRTCLATKTKFCNFIYSNPHCVARNVFYMLLSEYKQIDAAGPLFSNTSGLNDRKATGWRTTKIPFIRPYKFTIAFENSSSPGYTTEKIVHAFAAGSVPIYWGDPMIARVFNPNAFINCHDFKDFNAVVEHIIEVDNNNARYLNYLESSPFINDNFEAERETNRSLAVDRFAQIFKNDTPSPVFASLYNRFLRLAHREISREVLKKRRQTKARIGKLYRPCRVANRRGCLWEYTKSIADNYRENASLILS